MHQKQIYRTLFSLLILILFLSPLFFQPSVYGQSNSALNGVISLQAGSKVYLPFVMGGRTQKQIMLGVYTDGYIGTQSVIDKEVIALNSWAAQTGGKGVSIVGTFLDLEDAQIDHNLFTELETAWNNNLVVFMNISANRSAADIASGKYDAYIAQWAATYKRWISSGYVTGKWAMMAPLPEMNGYWTAYKLDPVNFKKVYYKFQDAFTKAGVPASAVRWVFAPNGYNFPGDPTFEDYYPGDARVSVVSFSSYNFGYCDLAWPKWESPNNLFQQYIERMQVMAPGKPIMIAQTASTSHTQANNPDESAKSQWLQDTYTYLAEQDVMAVIYFNLDKECDWAFYQPSGRKVDGYRKGVTHPNYVSLKPLDMLKLIP